MNADFHLPDPYFLTQLCILASDAEFSVTMSPEFLLGRGSTGTVWQAEFRGETVAAKTYYAFRDPLLYGLTDPQALKTVCKFYFLVLACK